MSKTKTPQSPHRGTSTDNSKSPAEKTAAILEELIDGENKYKSIVDAVFWLFNDLKHGGRFDELLELVRRLKEFLFIPEYNQAFCKDLVMLESENLYNLLDKLHDFIEEIYTYQGDGMLALDLHELKTYPGQNEEVRINHMLKQYTIKLELKKAESAIKKDVETRFANQ